MNGLFPHDSPTSHRGEYDERVDRGLRDLEHAGYSYTPRHLKTDGEVWADQLKSVVDRILTAVSK